MKYDSDATQTHALLQVMIVLRIVAVLSNNEELARHVQVSSFADVCAHISSFMNEIHVNNRTQVIKVLVQTQHLREVLSNKPLSVVNMYGKITHIATLHVHTPGVKAYIKKERNNFGLTDTAYTV